MTIATAALIAWPARTRASELALAVPWLGVVVPARAGTAVDVQSTAPSRACGHCAAGDPAIAVLQLSALGGARRRRR